MEKMREKVRDFTELKFIKEHQMHILGLKNTVS